MPMSPEICENAQDSLFVFGFTSGQDNSIPPGCTLNTTTHRLYYNYANGTDAHSSIVPVCESDAIIGDAGTTFCPSGWVEIPDASSCQTAASTLHARFNSSTNLTDAPAGCIRDISGVAAYSYWNERSGPSNPDFAPICTLPGLTYPSISKMTRRLTLRDAQGLADRTTSTTSTSAFLKKTHCELMNDPDSDVCPDGFVAMSEARCESAQRELSLGCYYSGHDAVRPLGCSFSIEDHCLYYNYANGTANMASSPLCVSDYLAGVGGATRCPSGYVKMINEVQCASAAMALHTSFMGAINSTNAPGGCYYQIDTGESYWNEMEGLGGAAYTLICTLPGLYFPLLS